MPELDSRKNAEPTPAPILRSDTDALGRLWNVDQVLEGELVLLGRPKPPEVQKPEKEKEQVSDDLAKELFGHNLTALCLSGGGIRSASFCLGILQALAKRKLLSRFDYLSTVSGGGYIGSWLSAWRSRKGQSIAKIEESLALTGKPKSEDNVEPEPDEVKTEPDEIKNLRDFTSYLTPRRGLMSSDTWASIANLIRNLVLNWMLFLPLLLLLVWIPKFTVLVFELLQNLLKGGVAPSEPGKTAFCLLLTAAAALYVASQLFTSWEMIKAERPPSSNGAGRERYLFFGLLLAYAAACFSLVDLVTLPAADHGWEVLVNALPLVNVLPVVLVKWAFVSLFAGALLLGLLFTSWQMIKTEQQHGKEQQSNSDKPYGAGQGWYVFFGLLPAYIAACIGSVVLVTLPAVVNALPAVLVKALPAFLVNWAFVSLFAGALLWGLPFLLAFVCLRELFKAPPEPPSPISSWECWKRRLRFPWLVAARFLSGACFGIVMFLAVRHLAGQDDRYVVVFGISGFFLAHLAGSTLFAGLSTFAPNFDAVREWTARAGGWFLVSGLVWTVYASLVLWDPHIDWPATLLPEGWPRKLIDSDWTGKLIKAGGLISGIAAALFGHSPSTPAKEGQKSSSNNRNRVAVAGAVFFSTVVIFELSRVFDWAVLPDSDSLASLTKRHKLTDSGIALGLIAPAILVAWAVVASLIINVNKFSLHTYYRNRLIRCYLGASNKRRWPNAFTGFDEGDNRKMAKLPQDKPFHIISITLNLAHGKNLAWQERKATSFTVSPLAVGNPHLGYRRAEKYGDEISLGTAMAISGAAASPNMGYHSSPPLALLMTLFNVRLGWWLGNPKRPRSWKISAPRLGFWPFIMELFGLTDDEGRFVYLSDGGHFENLGIYEMLRRCCRTIVAVDAVCDPKFEFEDLGNAIRKARIDFGVEVSFSRPLTPSPDRIATRLGLITSPTPPNRSPYCAIGRIRYPGISAEGTLIYIKAAIHGDEPEDILSYAAVHNAFPHESTLDQFFTESKFESYRRLGLHIGSAVFSRQHEDGSDAVDELAKLANEHVAHAGAVAT